MGKEIRVEGREGNKINGRIYTPVRLFSSVHAHKLHSPPPPPTDTKITLEINVGVLNWLLHAQFQLI